MADSRVRFVFDIAVKPRRWPAPALARDVSIALDPGGHYASRNRFLHG
tara:strand:+ start:552 stop:695 length:144 start_codon:yes stop_codon:yes gene_type:complete